MAESRGKVLIIGGAGTVGRVLRAGMPYEKVVLDVVPENEGEHSAWFVGNCDDPDTVDAAIQGTDAVIFLASGMGKWDAMLSAEIGGLKVVCDSAIRNGVGKIVFASSNHAVGLFERELLESGKEPTSQYLPTDPPRPDSIYGVGKVWGEALCRLYAETTPLKTSCIRIGSINASDDPRDLMHAPHFANIPGGPEGVLARLTRTWFAHPDVCAMFTEEVEATDDYRLRFGISDNPGAIWSREVYAWSAASR